MARTASSRWSCLAPEPAPRLPTRRAEHTSTLGHTGRTAQAGEAAPWLILPITPLDDASSSRSSVRFESSDSPASATLAPVPPRHCGEPARAHHHSGVLMIFLLVLVLATVTSAGVTALFHRFGTWSSALGHGHRHGVRGSVPPRAGDPVHPAPSTWVPLRAEIVLISGLVEIALALALLLPPPARRRVGAALALYLVAVFPGNVYVAVFDVEVDGQPGGAYPWVRLPLQLLFIAWAVWSTREARGPVPRELGDDLRIREATT